MSKIVHQYTKVKLYICRYQIDAWDAVYRWLEKFKRLAYVDISSSNCKSSVLRQILRQLHIAPSHDSPRVRVSKKSVPGISITKCFAITEEVIQDMKSFENVALSDIEIQQIVPLSFFANLNVLIFSNNTFASGSLQHLFEQFPSSLTVLALGGCKNLTQSYHTMIQPACLRDNLCIEVTFLEKNDRLFLQMLFPHATFMDLTQDSVDQLEVIYSTMHFTETRMTKALLSCHDGFNSTPLHVACRKGDLKRCQWLLSLNGRVDLKDCKGCTPLHRAVEASQVIKRMQGQTQVQNSRIKDTTTALLCDNVDATKMASAADTPPLPDRAFAGLSLCDEALPEPAYPKQETPRYSAWQCAISCLQAGGPRSCLIRNQNYETPLYVAALRGNDVVLYSMISHLRKKRMLLHPIPTFAGDYLALDEKSSDLREFSPLQAAILSKSLYCIQLLLQAGCSPNKPNKNGSTAMHLAFRSNEPAIITMITDAGGNLDVKDASGDLPMRYAPGDVPGGHHTKPSKKRNNHKKKNGASRNAKNKPSSTGERKAK